MNIVGPLLLLGGAIFVVSKRCELLGICGDVFADSGDTSIDDFVTDDSSSDDSSSSDSSGTGASGTTDVKRSGCCTCGMQGDRVKCHRGDGAWFNPPAGSGGSNDQDVDLSLEECKKGCSGSSSSSSGSSSSKSSTGARANVRGNASVSTPRLQASGNARAGAGAGGSRTPSRSSTTTKRPSSARPGGAVVKAGASFYGYRSYFVDPYYVRPFTLYHRIAN